MAYEILHPAGMHPVRGVLFDMDGLVLDTEKLYSRFWMEAAREMGYPMTVEQSLGMRSLNKTCGQNYLERCFGPGIDYQQVRAVRIRRMNAWIEEHGVEVKPGVYELLRYLHERGIPCAITTSSPPERVKRHLSSVNLYDQFDEICSGYEVAHGKPEPDIYLYGASRLHLKPEACLALEDSPAGIQSAYRAGCMPVVIPDQDQPEEETLSRCFAKADCLTDLREMMDRMPDSEVRLVPLNDSIKEEFLSLRVYDEQNIFVESPEESLADKKNHGWGTDWTIECIYAADRMIGYAMHGMGKDRNVWLDRFMVDRRFQGRGYGTAALTQLIRKMQQIYPGRKNILLSVEKHNERAIKMYERFGFQMTDAMDGIYPVMAEKDPDFL